MRVQCKTGRLRNGSVIFSTRSVRSNRGGWFVRDYGGDIDLFAVFCPDTGQVYAVPVDEAPAGYANLRVAPTANKQSRGIRWAADFELPA